MLVKYFFLVYQVLSCLIIFADVVDDLVKRNTNQSDRRQHRKQNNHLSSPILRRNSTGSSSNDNNNNSSNNHIKPNNNKSSLNGMNSHTAAINLQTSAGQAFSSSVVRTPNTTTNEWFNNKHPVAPVAPARHHKGPAPKPGAFQQQQIQQPQYQTALQAHSNHGNGAVPPLPPHTFNVSQVFYYHF